MENFPGELSDTPKNKLVLLRLQPYPVFIGIGAMFLEIFHLISIWSLHPMSGL